MHWWTLNSYEVHGHVSYADVTYLLCYTIQMFGPFVYGCRFGHDGQGAFSPLELCMSMATIFWDEGDSGLFIVYILPKYRNSAQVRVLLLGPLKETTWGNYGKKLPLHGNSPTACTLHGSLKITIFFSAENLKLRKQSAN